MRKVLAASAILIVVLLVISVFTVLSIEWGNREVAEKQGIFVGVTYCGDSVAGGKLLIDKVKHYTNLFVLQSASLQRDFESVDELGDYAVKSGMYFLPYFGVYVEPTFSDWVASANQSWGDHFLGVYYSDEPGGKMLDANVQFDDNATGNSIIKTTYGDVVLQMANGTVIQYEINGGIIHLSEPAYNNNNSTFYSTFYPNGTITGQLSDQSSFKTYQDLMNLKPLKNNDEAAQTFLSNYQNQLEPLKNNSKIFTSDYALYSWDYLSGYDVVLAQIGWNLTVNQQISLVRGAATVQNKDWGIVITWKYEQPPYLDNASVILDQMRTAYQCGAKYFVLFNYYGSDQNPYGTLTDEDFQALQSFWNNVVNNPKVIQGSIKADSVVILPQNYGWGARWDTDHIWGIFAADNETEQYWSLIQTTLQAHGLKTDIVYEDQEFPLPATYQNIYRSG